MSLTLQINAVYSVTTDPWPTVAAAQPAAADEDAITPESFSEAEEGDVFAFEDRNHLWDDWPGRCVFVVLGDDCIYLFDSEGARIDEPESFVVDGVQPLNGSDGFFDDWRSGYYRMLDEPAARGAEGGGEDKGEPSPPLLKDFWVEGRRVHQAIGEPPQLYGALVGPPLPVKAAEPGFFVGFDDGDLQQCSHSLAKKYFEGGRIGPATAEFPEALIGNEHGGPRAVGFTIHNKHPIGVLRGAMPTPALFDSELLYAAHHIQDGAFAAKAKRPRRGGARSEQQSSVSQQDRQGLHTFRTGDIVKWTAGEPHQLPGEHAEAVVFRVMYRPADSSGQCRKARARRVRTATTVCDCACMYAT